MQNARTQRKKFKVMGGTKWPTMRPTTALPAHSKGGIVSKSATVSDRVKNNSEAERAKINALFMGATIPSKHVLSAYGLHLAGVEYFDHLRAYRSKDSYVKRTLLTDNPAKANLTKTIRALVAA